MSASCVCLWILRICSDRPFYRAPLGNWLFHVQVAGFQPPDAVKRYLTGDFQVFYTRTRSSYSKAFIYLKSLIISCELFVKKLISASASRHQHRHCKKSLAKFLFLSFEVSHEENINGEVLFKYTCTPYWKFQRLFRAVIL